MKFDLICLGPQLNGEQLSIIQRMDTQKLKFLGSRIGEIFYSIANYLFPREKINSRIRNGEKAEDVWEEVESKTLDYIVEKGLTIEFKKSIE